MTSRKNNNNPTWGDENIELLIKELSALRENVIAAPAVAQKYLDAVHPDFYDSAVNLLHYLALRRHDLRPLQCRLSELGLSSLGRAEAHVLTSLEKVLYLLHNLKHDAQTPAKKPTGLDFSQGQQLLKEHTDMLLGQNKSGRDVRIMVTMPSEAADDYTLVHNLLKQGMDCMRINCAHDNADVWLKMIQNLKMAEQALEKHCRIVMDLAGPKLRTGPMEAGPAVIHIRPERDAYGRIVAPARIWLTVDPAVTPPPSQADATLPVPAKWLQRLHKDDIVSFRDTRESKRHLLIMDVTQNGCWAEITQSAYVVSGTVLQLEKKGSNEERKAAVSFLPHTENTITLYPGDLLLLTRDLKPGRPATRDSVGQILTPAHIGCTLPEVFDDIRSGETIQFDDGKIGGLIEKVEAEQVFVRITHARMQGEKLRSDKGINLPDSHLHLTALTQQDLDDLPFVIRHADVVELSFANSAADVELLQNHMKTLGEQQPAIVLKIETRRGFENLPDMLLTAMRAPKCGVMIARGDLAVECGFERLAEVQEEILWICEAAHIPVIWATQVLESLAKEGMPSRAEITDAAMGHRSECVMLNKGPYVLNAVQVLNDILRRMQSHQSKKQSMLRELHLAHIFPD